MAQETDDNVAVLRRRVVAHGALREGLEAARIVGGSDRLVLETDVVVVGSGAGGSFVAAELAAKTDQRVLILEKGDFVEPTEFLQRERLMMPRIFDTEFSVHPDLRPGDPHRLHRRGRPASWWAAPPRSTTRWPSSRPGP